MGITGSKGLARRFLAGAAAVPLLLLLLSGMLGAKAKADAEALAEARAAVAAVMEQVLKVLSQTDLTIEERRSQIEAIAYENFDFKTMSKLVLRRDWKKFSAAQQTEFIAEFKTHLSQSYGSRLERYNQEEIEILGERAEARGDVTVMTAVVGGQFDQAKVDYRMRNNDAGWLAIDVTIEGVSLVSNFHSQFAGIVGRGGPEELLKQLREKNASTAVASAPVATGG